MAETTPREALAKRVDRARTAADVSELELANRTHIPRTTLQRKLAGVAEFTVGELATIATVLDLDLSVLVNEYATGKAAA